MKRCFSLLISLIFIFSHIVLRSEAREISKSGEIFKTAKDGVVTVLTTTHGSGFLVDAEGLILTNSHVVNEAGENIRVRFGPGEVLQAALVENDRAADVAIIRVNLKNVKNYMVLPLFTPPKDEPLVMVGEKVIAIGSPIKWETLEKTLTEGVVGKYEGDTIRHDASINGGNSGGPLLNFDGQVVGINTFGNSDRGPSIAGTISISKALPALESAKQKLKSLSTPSESFLADIPKHAYPSEVFTRFDAETEREILKKTKLMTLDTTSFTVQINTPIALYRALKHHENITLAERKKRAARKKFNITEDELETKNEIKDWDYKKPVVSIFVKPKASQTIGSALAQGLVAGLVSYQAAMAIPSKFVYRKDFLRLSLKDSNDKGICDPYLSTRRPFTNEEVQSLGLGTTILIDKSYIGVYEFDGKCFDRTEPIKLVIETEGDKGNITFTLKDTLKQVILDDFKPYWEYVAKLEDKQSPKVTPSELVQATTNQVDDKAILENMIKEAAGLAEKQATTTEESQESINALSVEEK